MLGDFYELEEAESFEHSRKMTRFRIQFNQIGSKLVNLVAMTRFFTTGNFYELKEAESFAHSVKMTHFPT